MLSRGPFPPRRARCPRGLDARFASHHSRRRRRTTSSSSFSPPHRRRIHQHRRLALSPHPAAPPRSARLHHLNDKETAFVVCFDARRGSCVCVWRTHPLPLIPSSRAASLGAPHAHSSSREGEFGRNAFPLPNAHSLFARAAAGSRGYRRKATHPPSRFVVHFPTPISLAPLRSPRLTSTTHGSHSPTHPKPRLTTFGSAAMAFAFRAPCVPRA